ncbi:hypothetical protein H4R24_000557 [Coemansia sp. RSA 988]|nr:hypothetical protein H4R24_000557 [Coemansia sp. RSA 988]
MQSFAVALAATAAVVAANKAPAGNYQNGYATVPAANYVPVAQPVAAQPVSVVQNAASAEPTVTETVTNGAASNAMSLGAVFLAGTALFSYF